MRNATLVPSILISCLLLGACGEERILPVCGNGVVEGRELCDDGNLEPGDGCDESCMLESRELCDNGVDDDGDGSADCADPDCFSNPLCQGSEVCTNGFDDDGDGLVDCADPDCATHFSCQVRERCDNGADDDGDGLIDCEDGDCSGHPLCGGCDAEIDFGALAPGESRYLVVDTAEAQGLPAPLCAEGPPALHMRFEVAVGFHLRVSAAALSGSLVAALLREEEPGVTCETDELLCRAVEPPILQIERSALPPGSYRVVLAAAEPGSTGQVQLGLSLIAGTEEICDNGIDDDGDGLVDCDDPGCAGEAGCLVEDCDNGVDDDGDNLVDCADPDCAQAPPCLPPEDCDNGLDDDGDGRADCADEECAGTAGCLGSDCVVNADLGRLGRGAMVSASFDTRLATHDNRASCGGDGPEVVMAFTLDATATVRARLHQTGDHVLALGGEAGAGSWCDDAEYRCVDPGGSGRPGDLTVQRLGPARYFLWVDAVSSQSTGEGSVILEVHPPFVELCDNKTDDDDAGLEDCDDPDCAQSELCLPETACHDGLDNDGDGWADCADFDCASSSACAGGACLPDRSLGTLAPGLPALVVVSTLDAADEFETSCAGGGGGGDVVISFEVAVPGNLSIGAQQHDFSDHVVALMCQGGPGSACDAAEHGCVDAGAPGLPIAAMIDGIRPGSYFLLVEPYGAGGSGAISLQVTLLQ